jgi:uncharacterized protein (TIGR01244 family)
MSINTLKTSAGFLATMLRKIGVLKLPSESIEEVFNYLAISESLYTSGQPSESELALVAASGFTTVVNLAPHNAENSLQDEAGVVNGLGLEYIHMPVDFKRPTTEDFSEFAQIMTRLAERKVWVHCAANMRVSAFVYRYRVQVRGDDMETAANDLREIWQPFGVWKTFIDAANKSG